MQHLVGRVADRDLVMFAPNRSGAFRYGAVLASSATYVKIKTLAPFCSKPAAHAAWNFPAAFAAGLGEGNSGGPSSLVPPHTAQTARYGLVTWSRVILYVAKKHHWGFGCAKKQREVNGLRRRGLCCYLLVFRQKDVAKKQHEP